MTEPPTPTPADEPLALLLSRLGESARLFQTSPDGGREGAALAVESVAHFLMLVPGVAEGRLQAPIAALLDALRGLDDGRIAPLLRPNRASGRPRLGAIAEGVRGSAAFTVRRLIETGLRPQEARELVAKELASAGIEATRGRFPKLTERTIRGWVQAIDADVGRTGEGAQTYDGFCESIPRLEERFTVADARKGYLLMMVDAAKTLRAADT